MLCAVTSYSNIENEIGRSIYMDLLGLELLASPFTHGEETLNELWFLPMKLSNASNEVAGLILLPITSDSGPYPAISASCAATQGMYRQVGFFHVSHLEL